MIFKPRSEGVELKLLRSLIVRMDLPDEEKKTYLNSKKGYQGEQQFDEWLEKKLANDWLILNDLLLESNNTVFQVDTMLISPETIYLFEVKNYEGDFYIEADRWYTLSKTEISNPLLQLKRSESLFRRLLQDLKFNGILEAYVIFVNPNFFLYKASLNLPMVFPTQLTRFMGKLNMKSSKIKDRQVKLAEKLVSLHLSESPYTRLPDYNYDQLKKGIICANCDVFMVHYSEQKVVCENCGCIEKATTAILRSIDEFKLLFPEYEVTTKLFVNGVRLFNLKK